MDLIWEGILLADSDGWNMVEITIYDIDNLCRGLLQALLHGKSDFAVLCDVHCQSRYGVLLHGINISRTYLCLWTSTDNVDDPLLPANLILSATEEDGLLAFCLAELKNNLHAAESIVATPGITCRWCLQGSYNGGGALFNQRFQVHVLNYRKRKVKDIAAHRCDGKKVAVEENGVEDAWWIDKSKVCSKGQLIGFLGRTFDDILGRYGIGEYF